MKSLLEAFFGKSLVLGVRDASSKRRRRSRTTIDMWCERLEARTALSVNPGGSDGHLVAPPVAVPAHVADQQVVHAVAAGPRVVAAPQPTVLPRLTPSVPDVVERGSPAVFTLTLSQPATKAVSVAYTTRDLRGRAGIDYTAVKGVARFAAGETTKTISVPTLATSPANAKAVNFQLVLSGASGVKLAGNTATTRIVDPLPPAPPSDFQITVTFPDSSLSYSQQRIFTLAAQRWSEVIQGDLPAMTFEGRTIDDVEISATAPTIDGVGGILGQAAYTQVRTTGTRLPYLGFMEFDSADVSAMTGNGSLYSVILHEMGHVLGVGSLWRTNGLVTGLGTTNPVYVGAKGVAEYNKLLRVGGQTSVPVENLGGAGTAGAHWRETVFGAELMTGFAEGGGKAMPLSALTVAALDDLGYTVNYAKADPYTLPASVGGTGAVRANPPSSRAGGAWLVSGATTVDFTAIAGAAELGDLAGMKPRTATRPRG